MGNANIKAHRDFIIFSHFSILKFHQTDKENHLFATADDLKINCWNLENGSLLYQLSGHYSRITSLSIHHSGYLASCGRDKVVMLWDLDAKTCLKTLPVFESLEGVVCLPNKFELPGLGEISGGVHVATVGEKGNFQLSITCFQNVPLSN